MAFLDQSSEVLHSHLQNVLRPVTAISHYPGASFLGRITVVLWPNTMIKGSLGTRGLILLTFLKLQFIIDGSQGKSIHRQELGGRSWCRDSDGGLLTGLFLMACSVCCLRVSISPGAWYHLQWVGRSHINCLQPVLWRSFLTWESLLSYDYNLCQVDKKN